MSSFTQDGSMENGESHRCPSSDRWQAMNGFGLGGAGAAIRPVPDEVGARIALLARTIQHEIIPRLMHAHRTPPECMKPKALGRKPVLPEDVAGFARMVLSRDDAAAPAFIDALRSRGASVEMLYLDLLAPVARHLGEMWDDDLVDGVDLTIALGRLQQLLREMSPGFCHAADRPVTGLRLLLLPGPGEQCTFGLVLVAEFFHRAGWDITFGLEKSRTDAAAAVRREWFDVVAFTQSGDHQAEALAGRIRAVRLAALNPQLVIMLGDPVLVVQSDYAAQVKADILGNDSRQAPSIAEALVASRLHRERTAHHQVAVPSCK